MRYLNTRNLSVAAVMLALAYVAAVGQPIGGAGAVWGKITGTLSAQTDLNAALSGKAASNASTTVNGTTCALGSSCSPGVAWGGITGTLSSQSDLNTALNGKAASNASTTVAGQTCALGGSCSIASTNLSDGSSLATTTAVDGKTSGLPVTAATFTALSQSPTYNNGSSGVGATLTATSIGALTIDGYTPIVGDRVLIGGQASQLQNGIYTLTHNGSSPGYVLTRATDFDTVAKINSTGGVFVQNNGNTYNWYAFAPSSTPIVTLGTDAITFTQLTAQFTPPYLKFTTGTGLGSVFGPIFAVTQPSGTFAWTNQGSSTATAVNGSIQLSMPRDAGGANQLRAYMQTLPASTGYTLIVGQSSLSQAVGACISDGTKLIAVWQQTVGTITSFEFSNSTTIGANYFGDNTVLSSRTPLWWIRFQSTGGNRTVSVSANGQLWDVLNTQADGTFLVETKGGPCYETNTALDAKSTLVDFRLTQP